VEVHSVFADGASASGSACFLMQNLNWWTERNTFIDVSDGYNCYKGYRFYAPSSSLPSFGYNRFLDIKANTAGAQYAVSFEGHTYMYMRDVPPDHQQRRDRFDYLAHAG